MKWLTMVESELLAETESSIALRIHGKAVKPIDGRMWDVVVQVRGELLTAAGVAAELRALADELDSSSLQPTKVA